MTLSTRGPRAVVFAAVPALAIAGIVGVSVVAANGSPSVPAEKAAAIASEKPPTLKEQQAVADGAHAIENPPKLSKRAIVLAPTQSSSAIAAAQNLVRRDYGLIAGPALRSARQVLHV